MGKNLILSVIIITRNEEKNISDCLESVKWADEIIVIDQSSTDKTVDICRKYTDNVSVVEPKYYCEPDRAVALEKSEGEWILYLDADERVSPELKNEIIDTISHDDPKYKCYYMARRNYFLGKWIKGCGWYPGYVLRLFKKGTVTFSEKIHQDGKTTEKCGYLKNDLIHLSYRSIDDYFEKFYRYTNRLATEEFEKGTQINLISSITFFVIKPAIRFFRTYFLYRGFLEGFRGLYISFSSALVIFITYAKLWEKQKVHE